MEYPKLFKPVIGKAYINHGGGEFRCLWSSWSSETGGTFINTKSGWTFTAHGCRQYEDGTIEWDYSTGGYFNEEALI